MNMRSMSPIYISIFAIVALFAASPSFAEQKAEGAAPSTSVEAVSKQNQPGEELSSLSQEEGKKKPDSCVSTIQQELELMRIQSMMPAK